MVTYVMHGRPDISIQMAVWCHIQSSYIEHKTFVVIPSIFNRSGIYHTAWLGKKEITFYIFIAKLDKSIGLEPYLIPKTVKVNENMKKTINKSI